MKHFKTAFLICVFVLSGAVLMPIAPAHASTNAELLTQIQFLKAQLAALEQELLLRSAVAPVYTAPVSTLGNCYTTTSGARYCYTTTARLNDSDDIDTVEVDFVGDMAQVRVEFDDDDDEFYAFEANTLSEVAELIADELNISVADARGLVEEVNGGRRNRDDDDIRDIDVDFVGDDADVVVRFEDGDTDRFTLRNVDRSRNKVIEKLADRYDEDEDDIEDVTDFDDDRDNDDDIRSIDVDFDDDDADVVVRFEDNDTERFTLTNVDDDEDEVIERLADRYDMDEDDIVDVIDFD